MDLANITSIYGKPIPAECEFCHGEGCEACFHYGYSAYSANRETKFVIEYPMYVAVNKRYIRKFLKIGILLSLSFFLIITIFVSYLINFTQHG